MKTTETVSPTIRQNAVRAFLRISELDRGFIPNEENFNTLREWLRAENITDEMLAGSEGEDIFISAIQCCSSEGRLERNPPTAEMLERSAQRAKEIAKRFRDVEIWKPVDPDPTKELSETDLYRLSATSDEFRKYLRSRRDYLRGVGQSKFCWGPPTKGE